jgi:hypothetical protein
MSYSKIDYPPPPYEELDPPPYESTDSKQAIGRSKLVKKLKGHKLVFIGDNSGSVVRQFHGKPIFSLVKDIIKTGLDLDFFSGIDLHMLKGEPNNTVFRNIKKEEVDLVSEPTGFCSITDTLASVLYDKRYLADILCSELHIVIVTGGFPTYGNYNFVTGRSGYDTKRINKLLEKTDSRIEISVILLSENEDLYERWNRMERVNVVKFDESVGIDGMLFRALSRSRKSICTIQ